MKLFAAMFIAATMFAVTGCSKDDEGSSINRDDVVGSWSLQKMIVTQTVSGLTGNYAALNGSDTRESGPEEGESSIFNFNNDGVLTAENTFIDHDNDDAIVTETGTGTWSLSGKNLTIDIVYDNSDTDHQVFVVDEVTSTKLVLSIDKTMTDNTSIPGQVATITYSVKVEYKRI
jgi:hypothetical protein